MGPLCKERIFLYTFSLCDLAITFKIDEPHPARFSDAVWLVTEVRVCKGIYMRATGWDRECSLYLSHTSVLSFLFLLSFHYFRFMFQLPFSVLCPVMQTKPGLGLRQGRGVVVACSGPGYSFVRNLRTVRQPYESHRPRFASSNCVELYCPLGVDPHIRRMRNNERYA